MEKKRAYNIIVPTCVIVVLAAICWWGYSRLNFQEEQADVDLYALIPNDCEAILETKDINSLYKTINNSQYIHQYNQLNVSDLLKLLTDNIEIISQNQAHGLSTEMNRQLLVSFHHPGTTHDQVIYGRFGNGDISSINKLIQKSIGNTHTPKKQTYKGEEIIIYPIGKDFLACYIQPGFFAASFQKKLIEQVIDTYQNENSVSQNESFISLGKQRKHNEQLSLYLHPEGNNQAWQHYEIRMSASAIYLTNNQTGVDTTKKNMPSHLLLERIDETHLPRRVQLMAQLPFKQRHAGEEASSSITTLEDILVENGCNEVDMILFSQPMASDTMNYQLLMATFPTQHIDKVKSQLRFPLNARRRTSLWLQGVPYPLWQCPADTTLTSYFLPQYKGEEHWLSIYQNYLLIAPDKETIYNYLTEVLDVKEESPHTNGNNKVYQHCLGDLAEEANFTLVTDLNDLINHHPDIVESNTSLIPSFFFKHGDFFKHFMLSTQFIHADGLTSTQLILTYQGDSTLVKS